MLCECLLDDSGKIKAFCRWHQHQREDRLREMIAEAFYEGIATTGAPYEDTWSSSNAKKRLDRFPALD